MNRKVTERICIEITKDFTKGIFCQFIASVFSSPPYVRFTDLRIFARKPLEPGEHLLSIDHGSNGPFAELFGLCNEVLRGQYAVTENDLLMANRKVEIIIERGVERQKKLTARKVARSKGKVPHAN